MSTLKAFPSRSIEKLTQAAAILATAEGGQIEPSRLLALLYLAERVSIADRGGPMLGGEIGITDRVPFHADAKAQIASGTNDLWRDTFTTKPRWLCKISEPGVDELSEYEIEVLKRIHFNHTGDESWVVVEETRNLPECKSMFAREHITPELMMTYLGFPKSERDYIENCEQEYGALLGTLKPVA